MSIDAYTVAVKISLVENVTRGLMMMSRHFRTTDAEAKVLETRLKSIGKLAAMGGALTLAGGIGLSLFKKPIEEAMQYERRLASLRQMGLGDTQIADARKFVAANAIIGTSLNDRMRLFTEAQGSFRQSGMSGSAALAAAKTMTPILAQYEVATSMLGGEAHGRAEQAMRSLNKTVEMMGGLNDTNRARAIADGVFKAAQSSGRMVDERQLKQFFAYGSSATNQQNLRSVFGGLEPIIGELGGSTAAVGLRTAFTRTNGMMALMPRRLQAELRRLNMADSSGKQQTDDLARLQATDAIGYAQEIMRRYARAGITSRTDIERENAIIFGTNGSKVFNKIMSQMPVLLESLHAYDRAQGAASVVGNPANKALLAQMDLEKKKADLELHIGQVALPYFVRALEMVSNALDKVNAFATNNRTAFKGLVLMFGAISGAALAGGGLSLLVAGFQGLALLTPIMAPLAAAFNLIKPGTIQLLMFMAEGLAAGVRAFVGDLFLLGRFFLFNPVGLAITAIIAVGWLVWNNWKEIKASLVRSWAELGEGFNRLFHGDILGALTSFTAVFLRGFQTIFNTLIAGLNHVLPSALQISKFSFADDFADKFGADRTVRPGASASNLPGSIFMDGRKVGEIVTGHQTRAAGRPNTSGNSFDGARSLPSTLSIGF